MEETVLFSDNFGKFEDAVYRICHRYERKHVGSVLRGEAGRSEERIDVGIRPKNGLPRQFENWCAMTETLKMTLIKSVGVQYMLNSRGRKE